MVKKDKVEGFKATEKVRNELRKDLFRTGKTKKDWLADSVDKLDNLHKVRNKPDEKWVAIPASELEHLHSGYPEHYHFIYDRILEHCVQQNLEITFDNLLLDCIYFYNYNIMKYDRYTDDGLIVLEIEHDVGISYSEFTNKYDIEKDIGYTPQQVEAMDKEDTKYIITGTLDDLLKVGENYVIADKKTWNGKGYKKTEPDDSYVRQLSIYRVLLYKAYGIDAKYGCLLYLDKANDLDELPMAFELHHQDVTKEFLKDTLHELRHHPDPTPCWLCNGANKAKKVFCPFLDQCNREGRLEKLKLINNWHIDSKQKYVRLVKKGILKGAPKDPSVYNEFKGWNDFLAEKSIKSVKKTPKQLSKDQLEKAMDSLKANWSFYESIPDGWFYEVFDMWGLFKSNDPYYNKFFNQFIALRQTPAGRQQLFEAISEKNFDMIAGHYPKGAPNQASIALFESTKVVEVKNQTVDPALLRSDKEIGVHKILSHAENI